MKLEDIELKFNDIITFDTGKRIVIDDEYETSLKKWDETNRIVKIERYVKHYGDAVTGDKIFIKSTFYVLEIIWERKEIAEEIEMLPNITYEQFKKMSDEQRFMATMVEYNRIDSLVKAVNYLMKQEKIKSNE